MKRALVVQHVHFEGLGHFEPALRNGGYELQFLPAWELRADAVDLDGVDLLAVLGGPIGAYQSDIYPFLGRELKLLEEALTRGKPIVGVCLGAQLLAQVMGATVHPGHKKEIGIGACRVTSASGAEWVEQAIGKEFNVLHWHGDTFTLPHGATRIASNENYDNQAFCVGHQVLALQFHLEARAADIEAWLVGHAAELDKAEIDIPALRASVQAADGLLRDRAASLMSAWLNQQQ
jgi:GMP synthase (glutamine-hydrolysing)